MKELKKIWIVLFLLATLSPLGLLIPEFFEAGGAWGEESPSEVQKIVGFLPTNMADLAELWKAPLPDYALPGSTEATPLTRKSWDYFLSAMVGLLLCAGTGLTATKFLFRQNSATIRTQSAHFDSK